jgi:dethiobiotin synthetase
MIDKPIFVTGIGTGIGKTLVSCVLVEKLKADYWKPIQSGDLNDTDSIKLENLISNNTSVIHPEAYKLTQPFSPHKSAAIDGINIELDNIKLPATNNLLVIEGAGGLMVPLNSKVLMIDLIKHLSAHVILVSQNYLGSINHTLLSILALQQYRVPVMGIVFNGDQDADSESYILNYSNLKLLGHIPRFDSLDKATIVKAGDLIKL